MTYKLFEMIEKKLLSILENKYTYLGGKREIKKACFSMRKNG